MQFRHLGQTLKDFFFFKLRQIIERHNYLLDGDEKETLISRKYSSVKNTIMSIAAMGLHAVTFSI